MTNKIWWLSSDGRIEFQVNATHVDELQGGDNLPYIKSIMPTYKDVFTQYSTDTLMACAIEYGSNDYGSEGTPTREEAEQYILWCALWDTYDNQGE